MLPLRKFAALSHGDRKLILAAASSLASSLVALRIFGFVVANRFANGLAERRERSSSAPAVEKISWAVEAASVYLPGCANCLVRALATKRLLNRFGYPSELRIGVAKDSSGGIAAHAWLESEGRVVIGDFELSRYAPLASNTNSGSHPELRGMA